MGMSEVVAYNWFRHENPVAFDTELPLLRVNTEECPTLL
jgi:hypothetical protein